MKPHHRSFRRTTALMLTGSIAALLSWAGPSTVHAAGLLASDGATSDSFGISASLSGGIGLVGANRDDIGSADQGSAYVFRSLDAATGTLTQNVKLTASDGETNDQLGISASLSGSIGLVGAYGDTIGANANQGSAYVFRSLDTATGTITQNVKLIASDGAGGDQFGQSASLSGSIGLVGAIRDDIGANANQGSAYVFRSLDTATGSITENVKLTASDGAAGVHFGQSASLSGSIGLVGAYADTIGANSIQGSAYVFRSLDTATGSITQNVKLTASDGAASDFFGQAVSLSGSIGLVGATGGDIGANSNQGSAYVFRSLDTATGSITQNVKLIASDGAANDSFGQSVSLSGSIGLVGANSDDIGANANQGSAYLFRSLDTATGSLTQNVKLTASDGAANDSFGISVGLDGDQFVIGARGKNSSTGKAYSGSVASVTTLDAGSTSKTISQISFVSQDDWTIGQTTDANSVKLSAGDSANVTAAGKVVAIGQNAGSDNNTLVINGTLTANAVNVGAAGNTGNMLSGNGGSITTAGGANYVYINGTLQVGDSTLGAPVASVLDFKSSGGSGNTVLATAAGSFIAFDLFQRGGDLTDLTANAAAADRLRLFGVLDNAAGGTLVISDAISGAHTFADGDQWKLFDLSNGGSISNDFALTYGTPFLPGGLTGSFNKTTGIFSITGSVPEPSRALLVMLGLMGVVCQRRRRTICQASVS